MPARYFLILSLSLSSLTCAFATDNGMARTPVTGEWMSGDEIIKEYTDQTQTGMYSWTRDGQPVRFSEIHYDNAITEYSEMGPEDYTIEGVWSVKKDVICYYYNDPRIPAVNCFTVLKDGNCYYHYDDLHPRNFENLDQWNSVGYSADETPTCVPPIS